MITSLSIWNFFLSGNFFLKVIMQRHTHTCDCDPQRCLDQGRAYISEIFMIEKQTGKPCSAIMMEVKEGVVKKKTSIRSQGKDDRDMRGHTLLFPVALKTALDWVMCQFPDLTPSQRNQVGCGLLRQRWGQRKWTWSPSALPFCSVPMIIAWCSEDLTGMEKD